MKNVNYKTKLEKLALEIQECSALIDPKSLEVALRFIDKEKVTQQLPINNIDNLCIEIHPDNEVALTWRKQNNGIINIAFSNSGIATWAAYIEDPYKLKKGCFQVSDNIPDIVRNLIKKTSN